MNTLKMNFGEVLTREQMRNVLGGYIPEEQGTCGYILIGVNYNYSQCNVSKSTAKSQAEAADGYTHGYWCCDSCGSTSYCGS